MGDRVIGVGGVETLLEEERQYSRKGPVWPGQEVVGVQIPDRVEDVAHLIVKSDFIGHGVFVLLGESVTQQAKTLDRVNGVQ